MIRSAMGKAAWVGRTASMVFGLALVLALVLGTATMALAAVPGDPFRLGQYNAINAITQLAGSRDGAMLRIDNNNVNGTNAHALNLEVNQDKAPLKVNAAAGTATDLSADELDGKDSNSFLGKTEKAADADALDGKDASAFGIKTDHAFRYTDVCDSPLNTLNECAPVTVTVPEGKTYLVSVWSSLTAKQTAAGTQQLLFCPTQRKADQTAPSCISPFATASYLTLRSGEYDGGATSGETLPLSAGTYTFSTGISFQQHLDTTNLGKAITKVMVRDAAGAAISSAAIETQDAPRGRSGERSVR